jgi:hypothetical protein
MIALNIPAPAPTPIQRINIVRLFPPLVPAEQHCCIVRAREEESYLCAIIHPYRTAYLYASAFATLLPLLQAEVWPGRQMSEITWVDIAYATPGGSKPLLMVRTTTLDSATAEIAWRDRDPKFAHTWESRAWPVIDLLERIKA